MAIDATRGLPSFSEMYGAYKNRGGLADAINAGVSGFESGMKMTSDKKQAQAEIALKNAQAQEALGKATKDPNASKMDIRPFAATMDPGAFELLKAGATMGPNGELLIDKSASPQIASTYNAAQANKTDRERLAQQLDIEKEKVKREEAKNAADIANAEKGRELQAVDLANRAKGTPVSRAQGFAASAAEAVAPIMPEFIGNPLLDLTADTRKAVSTNKQIEATKSLGQDILAQNLSKKTVGQSPKKGPGSKTSPIPVYTDEDHAAVPSGSWFVDGTGVATLKR